MKKYKFGFTLAEVLITLGIIGVVAAITIPGLMLNYKAHRLRSQFLKSYSVIQQVFRQMEADEVSLDPKDYPIEQYYKVFGRYITGATDCGGQNQYQNKNGFNKPCFNHTKDRFTNLHGKYTNSLNPWVNDGSFLMQDGSLL
ncbi:MAG: type II secretion system GspH family protein, partial [Candidatus Gastranaerophilales bacterium]|nr:type II secretion system GspH family protein [Candidatus Gastranaerophilales bacterium]